MGRVRKKVPNQPGEEGGTVQALDLKARTKTIKLQKKAAENPCDLVTKEFLDVLPKT